PGEELETVPLEQQTLARAQRRDVLEGGLVLQIPLRERLEALRLPVVAVRFAQTHGQLAALELSAGVELQQLHLQLGQRVLELRGWGELDARLELLERRQGERHGRADEKGREECAHEECAQEGCERSHALRTSSAAGPRRAPSRTRDASYRAARRAWQSRSSSG